MPEVDLYQPIKQFLEAQGYTVKGEIGACDVVALRGDEGPLVVELKERLTLTLILQAVDRLKVSDLVYIAFRIGRGQSGTWRSKRKRVLSLARRLGLGLITVSTQGKVVPVLDPGPYRPRVDQRRRKRLLKEFSERRGDPVAGGSVSAQRLTAYRQDAILCARALESSGVLKLKALRESSGVLRAGPIVRDNHYGWFERARRGHYEITAKGRRELADWQ